MELTNKLKNNSLYPFHMPGHKRNEKLNIPSSELDITEIDGFDNLHSPSGILNDLQNELAEIYGCEKSIISVNGSTCCVLAAISAVSRDGGEIIIARNCHKSVYNACMLNRLKIKYIEPEYNADFGCCGRITQGSVDRAIAESPNACAVVITSPTYEGFVSKIDSTVPLIIDAAHGAHFGLHEKMPARQTADIVIHSLHKTLPALTQTAVVNIYNPAYFARVKKYMDIYETSSPSYVLMSSVDRCVDFIKDKNNFNSYFPLLEDFYNAAREIKGIKILNNDDPTRIVISADGLSGGELANRLRESGIEPEGAANDYVILISTVCDTRQGFELLINALKNIEAKSESNQNVKSIRQLPLPEKRLEIFEVSGGADKDFDETELEKSEGKISAEYVYAYPPGAPLIVPGEVIGKELIEYIKKSRENGVNILADSDLLPHKILTKS